MGACPALVAALTAQLECGGAGLAAPVPRVSFSALAALAASRDQEGGPAHHKPKGAAHAKVACS